MTTILENSSMGIGVILVSFTILILCMNMYFSYIDKKIYAGVLDDIEDSASHYQMISRSEKCPKHHISYRHHYHYVT